MIEYLKQLECMKCGNIMGIRCEYCNRIDCDCPLCEYDAELTREYEVYTH